MRLTADVVVVGSGPGGGAAARELAEAGLDTVVLEMGAEVPLSMRSQREEEMMPLLYQDASARTTADRCIQVIQGQGLGGSSLHNLNLCKRIPDELFDAHGQRLVGGM